MSFFCKRLFRFHYFTLAGECTTNENGTFSKVWRECSQCGERRKPTENDAPAVRQIHAGQQAQSQQWQNAVRGLR